MKHAKRSTRRNAAPRPFPATIPPEILKLAEEINQLCEGKNSAVVVLALGLLFGEGIHRLLFGEGIHHGSTLQELSPESQRSVKRFLAEFQHVILSMLKRYTELEGGKDQAPAGGPGTET